MPVRGGATLPPVSYDVTLVRLRDTPVATPPRITGVARPGEALEVAAPTPDGTSTGVEWLRDGRPMKDADSHLYEVTEADRGHRISARVTYTRDDYAAATRTTTAVDVPRGTLVATRRPSLKGRAAVGSRLTVTGGSWRPAPSQTSIQWYRDRTPLKGATSTTYRVTRADRRHTLRAVVTARRTGWTSGTATTPAVSVR